MRLAVCVGENESELEREGGRERGEEERYSECVLGRRLGSDLAI